MLNLPYQIRRRNNIFTRVHPSTSSVFPACLGNHDYGDIYLNSLKTLLGKLPVKRIAELSKIIITFFMNGWLHHSPLRPHFWQSVFIFRRVPLTYFRHMFFTPQWEQWEQRDNTTNNADSKTIYFFCLW